MFGRKKKPKDADLTYMATVYIMGKPWVVTRTVEDFLNGLATVELMSKTEAERRYRV